MKRFWIFVAVFVLIVAASVATVSSGVLTASVGGSKYAKITVTSKTFKNNGKIPVEYTMVTGDPEALNMSPQLSFKTKSKEVKAYAFIMYDKAKVAKNWVHWCVTGIPASEVSLKEGASNSNMPAASAEWANTYGSVGYGGPNPPKGSGVHKYEFWVVGLNTEDSIDLTTCTLKSFKKAIEGKVVAEGKLTGTYEVK